MLISFELQSTYYEAANCVNAQGGKAEPKKEKTFTAEAQSSQS